MTALTVTRVDPWRVDAHIGPTLVAYAIADGYGWALCQRVNGRFERVARVDYGSTARRDARVGKRLAAVALGLASAPPG